MSDRCKQQASALLDDHFGDAGTDAERPFEADLSALLDDQQAQFAWQRYALVGQIMRGDAQTQQRVDISAQVALAIAKEPTNLVQPKLSQGGAQARAAARWLKPAGSIAIAASVALVAVLSIQQPILDDPQLPADNQVTPAVVTNPFGGRNPVSYNTVVEQQAPSAAEVAQQRQLLQSYLLDHQRQVQLSQQNQQQPERTQAVDQQHDPIPDQND